VEFLGDGQPGSGAAFPHEYILRFVADDEKPPIVAGAEARAGGVELANTSARGGSRLAVTLGSRRAISANEASPGADSPGVAGDAGGPPIVEPTAS